MRVKWTALGLTFAIAVADAPVATAQTLGALAPANLAADRPEPAFGLTGLWLHGGGPDNGFRFTPPEGLQFTPEAQAHLDAAAAAAAEGKVYQNDIGLCWPAGLPLIMTRVWPIAMVQLPTAIYMISEFMNSLRIVYLDGREHTDPDLVVPSFNGESIGRWEGGTLVVDTRYFPGHHHWIDTGLPASEELHVVERIRLINDGNTMEIEYTFADPNGWEGEWSTTKRWQRVDDRDIEEVSCLPDLNDHMPTVLSDFNVR